MLQATLDVLGDDASIAGLITANAADAIFLMDGQGRTLYTNPAAERMFGWSNDELLNSLLHNIVHHHRPDGRPFPMEECPLGDVFVTGRTLVAHEDVFFHRDGRQIPVSCSNASIIRDGKVTGGVLIVRDITDRKQLEQQRDLLETELVHRIKNTVAVIQAIAQQSLQGDDVNAVRETFLTRLSAIGHAQALVAANYAEDAQLQVVLESTLRPFTSEASCATLSGPPVALPPKQALTLSMAIHELATNSLKYGALSVPDGKVTVSWTVDPDQERQRLRLVWTELGGPAVHPPARKGFGSRIIEKVLAADFTGKVALDYDPQGVRCSLDGFIPARSSTPR